MFWLFYLVVSILLSLLLASASKKYFVEVFILVLVLLFTPTQIEVAKLDYAPSIFTFIFNIIFQQEISTRALRPLLLTLPFCCFSLFLFSAIKKRFF